MRRQAILLMVTMGAALIVASGVALAETLTCDSTPPCYGTPEADEITGTANSETIYAYGGEDDASGGGENDTIYGGSGNDHTLVGEAGSDKVYGGGGNDGIYAYALDTAGSTDHSYGGGGNDNIEALDGNVDIINCGRGTDTVYYDVGTDTVRGCERKNPGL